MKARIAAIAVLNVAAGLVGAVWFWWLVTRATQTFELYNANLLGLVAWFVIATAPVWVHALAITRGVYSDLAGDLAGRYSNQEEVLALLTDFSVLGASYGTLLTAIAVEMLVYFGIGPKF